MTKTGPKVRFVNKTVAYEIKVANKGDGECRNTVLVDTLPAGLEFVSASDGGRFADGKVTWTLGKLAPKATKKVSFTGRATRMGMLRNVASATALCTKASAHVETDIQGIPAVLLEVIDLEDPIEVGNNETYLIVVTNQGSTVDTNIQITCTVPAEQEYVSSSGPTTATAKEKTVTFAPLASLAAKAKATYRVVVKGVKAGNVRFKVEMNTDQLKPTGAVMETESTNIYE